MFDNPNNCLDENLPKIYAGILRRDRSISDIRGIMLDIPTFDSVPPNRMSSSAELAQ